MKLTRRALWAGATLAYRAKATSADSCEMLWDYFVTQLTPADERRRRKMAAIASAGDLAARRTGGADAAALDPSIAGVATFQTLTSYRAVLEKAFYAEPLAFRAWR